MKLIRWMFIVGLFLFGFYFREEITAVVTSGSPFDQTMIRALIRCRMYPEEMAVLSNARGKRCTVPLPPGTTHFRDGAYLTATANFDKYLKFTLSEFGWNSIERSGPYFTIRDTTRHKKFTIVNTKYVGVFRRLKFGLE